MGEGLLTLANLGWAGMLCAAYYLATNFDAIPAEHKRKAMDLYHRVKDYPLPAIVMAVWLAIRVLFALGWQLQLELLLVMAVCNYGVRTIGRARARAAQDLCRELATSSNPTQVLGSRLPEWVMFPSANRVQWLNSVITGMWPSIVAATDTSLRAMMEPLLESNKPSYVKGFRIRSASIGPNPATVDGMQHHSYGVAETTLDINLSWAANMDIRLLVRVPGPDVEVALTDFELKLTLRVVLGPHIPQWPCFANMAFSIVNTPEVDFNITAGSVSLDVVPGLSDFLDQFIRRTLVGMLAYPKALVVPLVTGHELKRGLGTGALGTLRIRFLRIDNVQSKYNKYRKTPFYSKLMLDGQAKRQRTASYVGFDKQMKDVFSFTLYDNTGILRVSFAFDVPGKDLHVGECEITTKQLMETNLDEVELAMTKASDASRTRRVSVYIKPEFLVFTSREQQRAAVVPPESIPPRMSSASFREDIIMGRPLTAPSSRGNTPRNSGSGWSCNTGALFVHVDRAMGLKNIETVGTSDPYVFLRVGNSTAKSPHINNNLNPVFNWDGELAVTNCETDVLLVCLIDKNVSTDKLMGELRVPLARITASPSEKISGTYKLSPQGSVTLSASFLRHS
ncbi:putative calcium-dependent lipid binding protein putative synaptotagmin [Leptomonas seymouri]|uniref:Putative calcium-dependent lipid binding protein putative synaptotagmin n=1 Tax=Leptomonas seymouri TaxID=5684 RepID=A0A0N0P3J0_LEPSE|nr:putative calcium-dependent lipid binding protein putative synaptotagmin [Leptomonas seymouri]|eukprot:KPI83727.1 putative calcium-dependent lipid binding protein putative synaptotagmin [Leptomonas seymouri]